MTDPVTLTVPPDGGGARLDVVVSAAASDLSRSRAQALIRAGLVLVDGRAVTRPAERPGPGQVVSVLPAPPEQADMVPWDEPLCAVYEDSDLVVIDKPPGMPVHPAPGHPERTLANAVIARWPDAGAAGEPARPGIVHRLDADTSGLIVVARTSRAHAALSAQFAERAVEKTYAALVVGTPRAAEAVIDAPIGRSPHHRRKMAVVTTGRPAVTRYTVERSLEGCSLLSVRPETGRTHQIRVHLQSIGHPVIGDALYGRADPELGRQFLHASAIRFRHPEHGGPMALSSPLPDDLRRRLSRVLDSAEQMALPE